jgi:para-aminobenzoate synthetase
MHGRLSQITHTGGGIFQNLPQDFPAVRYHSLVVEPPREGRKEGGREGGGQGWELKATAWSEDGTLMGVEHVARPHYGVQFHPESIGSHYGHALLRNFQRLSWERARGREGGRDGGGRPQGVADRGGAKEGVVPSLLDPVRPPSASPPPPSHPSPETSTHPTPSLPSPCSSSVPASPSAPSSRPPRFQVLLTRLGGVGGVREEAGTDLSEAVFAALYARADSAFWLDSSATQCAEGGEGGKEGRREGRREGGRAAVPPAMGGRFSYMGDASSGSSLAHVLEYYLPPNQPPHPPPPPESRIAQGGGWAGWKGPEGGQGDHPV